MKKMFLGLLIVIMLFTIVGCGNNDENNAAVKEKIEEAEKLVMQIYTFYEEEGLLEGEHGEEIKPVLDVYVENIEETKEYHQKIVDNGGYNDEEAAKMIEALEIDIASYKKILEDVVAIVEKAK